MLIKSPKVFDISKKGIIFALAKQKWLRSSTE